MFTVAEIMERLHASRNHILILIRKGALKAVDIAPHSKQRRWRVRQEDLEEFMKKNEAKHE